MSMPLTMVIFVVLASQLAAGSHGKRDLESVLFGVLIGLASVNVALLLGWHP